MAEAITKKKCTKCGKTKPVSEFYRSKSSKDGYVGWDKACWKQSIADKVARREAEAKATSKRKRPAKKTT